MKMHIFLLVALGVLLFSPVLEAQELDDDGPGNMEELERQDLEARLHHEQRMRDLEYEEAKMELEHRDKKMNHKFSGKGHGGAAAIFLLICLVVHILLSVWVYTDIRVRNAGSGIWIVVTLLTGFFGCLLYAVVRMGDGNGGKAKKG